MAEKQGEEIWGVPVGVDWGERTNPIKPEVETEVEVEAEPEVEAKEEQTQS